MCRLAPNSCFPCGDWQCPIVEKVRSMKLTKTCFRGLSVEKLLSLPLKRTIRHETGCGAGIDMVFARIPKDTVTVGHVPFLSILLPAQCDRIVAS
jgi:hypothetical protein